MNSQNRPGWEATRERVLDRDGRTCRFCGMSDREHQEEYGRGVEVHHIIPRKDGGRDEPDNLVTVCKSCHRTLESLHARAIGALARREDHTEELRQVSEIHRTLRELELENRDRLWKFAKKNPVFRREFGIYKEGERDVYSRELSSYIRSAGGFGSEWEFVAKYGYVTGILDVLNEIEGRTSVPIDESDL